MCVCVRVCDPTSCHVLTHIRTYVPIRLHTLKEILFEVYIFGGIGRFQMRSVHNSQEYFLLAIYICLFVCLC